MDTGLVDFNWFPKVFPKRKLLVVGGSEFRSPSIRGVTIDQFLLADGLPHPYPGEVEDSDLYNNYCRF